MAYSVPTENEIRTALTYIDATERQIWVSVGTALKTEFGETGFNLFDEWSQTAQNYKSKDAKDAWRSFRIGKSNIGYIINQAKQNGWVREKQQPMNANEMAERQRRNKEMAKQAENQRIKAQKAAAEYAQNIWNKAKPVNPNHAYLQKKGIDNPSVLASIRQDKDALILPLRNRGEIVGIQKIFANGDKRFNRDIEKKGSALIIGNRDEMQHGFLMAEGFATAATLHIATGKPVVVAFDAGNLKEVSGSLKDFVQNHQTPVLICADKDENQTGEIKAKTAADVLGSTATVITPDFGETEIQNFQAANNGKKPTDFNDLQAIGGIERVKTALADSFRQPETLSVIASRKAWQSPDLEREVSGSLNDDKLMPENTNESVVMQTENALKPIQARNYDNDPIRKAIQDIVIDDVKANFALYQQEYRQHPESFGGRYICSDLFKETMPFYNADRETRSLFNGLVHNSAAVLADKQFYDALSEIRQENDSKGKVAVFLTGSPGAGKTSSVQQGMVDDANTALIYEGQLIRPETAIDKIQAALDSGLKVKILAVQNTPETALNNTIQRFEDIGRGSSIEVMAQIMGKTADGLDKLHQHFGDRIELEIHERHENTPLPPQKGWENLDILRKYGNYETTKQHLGYVVEQSKETGTYSEPAYNQAIGRTGRVEQKHTLSLTSALLAYDERPRVLGDSKKQSLLSALETLTPSRQNSEISTNPETPRPSQGGFVLPVENANSENRQAETLSNPKETNIMAEQNQLTASPPLEKQTFQPDTWQPDTTVIASEQSERGNLGTQENNGLNQEIATPATQVRNDSHLSGSLNDKPDTWQPETPEFTNPELENAIDFNNDKPIVLDEVARQETQPEMTPQEKVQAAFETLQQQYNGYRFNPETQKVEVLESKTDEAIHYQADMEKLIYSAVDNGERKTIGDIDIKDLTPEYLALSVENRRLAYNQTLLQNGFPNEEKRQELDQTADQLDESIREAKRKTETLKPPIAPPPPLDQRYAAVERKFMDNTTHYGERTNLGIKTRVDYVDVNNSRTVLFSDKGNKLTTSKNPDAQTVKDMVELAKAKGWDSVKLRGNKEFKRMAYIEMESQGIKTKGYSPSPQDLAIVEKLREERSLSEIENISGSLNEKDTVIASEQSERGNLHTTENGRLNQEIATPATQARNDENISGSLKNKPQLPEQNLSQEAKAFFDELHKNPTADKGGILLAHGKDNFQFKKDASKSYFATIQYPDGEKTYWGKDIERVLQENNINKGDRIDLNKTDRFEPVRVREVVKDKHGKPVLDENGQPKTEEVMHKRNVWEIKVYEKNNPDVPNGLNQETKQPESTVMASEQSERGNLGTQESNRLNQEIATPATQVCNDENVSGSLNEQKIAQQEINNAEYQAKKDRAYAYDKADKWEHLAMAQNDGEPVSQMQDEVQDMKYFAERGVSDSQVSAKSVVQGQSTQRKNISIRDVYHQRLDALPKAHRAKMLENEKVARAMFAFIDNPDEQKKAMENFYRTNAQEMGNTLQQLQGKEQERNQSSPTPEHSHQDDEMER